MVGRGAGTGLSGGAFAREGGVLIVFSRMNRILEIDVENQRAPWSAGRRECRPEPRRGNTRLHFAPDPSSQKACTIGGNVSENAGGPHTLAYGVTTNHVLGLKWCCRRAKSCSWAARRWTRRATTLPGLFVGSEGTFASGDGNHGEIDARCRKRSRRCWQFTIPWMTPPKRWWKSPRAGSRPRRAKCSTDGRCAPLKHTFTRDFRSIARRCCCIEVDGLREVCGVAGGRSRGSLPRASRARSARGARCRRARFALERPQECLRRRGADFSHLLHAGRRDSAHEIAGHAAAHQ